MSKRIRQLAAALLAVFVCGCVFSAAAEDELQRVYGMDLDLYLTYLDVSGEESSIYPLAVGEDDETVLLWGYLPDPTVEEITLHVSDINGLYTFSRTRGRIFRSSTQGRISPVSRCVRSPPSLRTGKQPGSGCIFLCRLPNRAPVKRI